MQQQPAQTGRSSIPAPPQHGLYPYPQMPQPPLVPSRLRPYPPELYTHLYLQFARTAYPAYGAPYLAYGAPYPAYGAPYVVPPHNGGGYPPAFQGTGVPAAAAPTAAAPPSYPSAPSFVQVSHNQFVEQGLEQQQTPVVAAGESAVRRGKRKAVDLDDDAAPRKKQPLNFDFDMVQINGELRYKCCLPQCEKVAPLLYASIQGHIKSKRHQKSRAQLPSPDCDKTVSHGDSSNIGISSSNNPQEAREVFQGPYEDSTSNEPLEHFPNSLEATANSASSEPLEDPLSTLDEVEQWKEFQQMVYSIPSGPLEDSVDCLEEPVHSASSEPLEGFLSTLDEAEQWKEFQQMVYSIPSGPLEDSVDSLEEPVHSASSEPLEASLSTPDETELWKKFKQMVYSIPSGPLEDSVDSLDETDDSALSESESMDDLLDTLFYFRAYC